LEVRNDDAYDTVGRLVLLLSLGTPALVGAQLMATCVEDSPERRGGIGCSIIENKLLPEDLNEPLFWHIDRFDSLERARAAVGPASVAFAAAGTAWLMTIQSQPSDHHGASESNPSIGCSSYASPRAKRRSSSTSSRSARRLVEPTRKRGAASCFRACCAALPTSWRKHREGAAAGDGPGVGQRAIPGHTFGLSLNPNEESGLLEFLRSL
jgi:hypothetical protein